MEDPAVAQVPVPSWEGPFRAEALLGATHLPRGITRGGLGAGQWGQPLRQVVVSFRPLC